MSSVPSPAIKQRHPIGLYYLFATEMWERYGFYTAAAIMTLYLQRGGFGWSKEQATTLWSNYLMFVYATPLIGGWLADKFLGYRRSVVIGGILFFLGYATLGLGSPVGFYAALAFLFIGNGFFKPNISTMVGNLYDEGSPLKDSAYNIFYMGINVGALLAPIVAELILQAVVGPDLLEYAKKGLAFTPEQVELLRRGFLTVFRIAAVGMTLGTLIFASLYRRLGAADIRRASRTDDLQDSLLDEDPSKPSAKSAIDKVPERIRIGALLVIYAIVVVFWMVFHQNGSTMTYWADENTRWKVSGVVSNAINPFWIVAFSIPLIWFWGWLRSIDREPSTPTKMALGMFFTAFAFFILYVGARSGGDQSFLDPVVSIPCAGTFINASRAQDSSAAEQSPRGYYVDERGEYLAVQHRVSPFWLIAAYMSISLGELMLSPMGLSLVSKVAPARMRGLMMGGWFVATAIGNKLTAIGILWTKWYHSSFWLLCMGSALFMGFVLLALLRPLKRAMPGV